MDLQGQLVVERALFFLIYPETRSLPFSSCFTIGAQSKTSLMFQKKGDERKKTHGGTWITRTPSQAEQTGDSMETPETMRQEGWDQLVEKESWEFSSGVVSWWAMSWSRSFPNDMCRQWFSTCQLWSLWDSNDSFTGVKYQIFCISYVYITINSSKIRVVDEQWK